MPEDTHKVFSLRVPNALLERIDYNAEHSGLSRTQYVLSQLAESYETNQETRQRSNSNNDR